MLDAYKSFKSMPSGEFNVLRSFTLSEPPLVGLTPRFFLFVSAKVAPFDCAQVADTSNPVPMTAAADPHGQGSAQEAASRNCALGNGNIRVGVRTRIAQLTVRVPRNSEKYSPQKPGRCIVIISSVNPRKRIVEPPIFSHLVSPHLPAFIRPLDRPM